MPKIISANLTVIFWAFIYGEVIGYIGSALEVMPYDPLQIGIAGAIAAFIGVNGAHLLSDK